MFPTIANSDLAMVARPFPWKGDGESRFNGLVGGLREGSRVADRCSEVVSWRNKKPSCQDRPQSMRNARERRRRQ